MSLIDTPDWQNSVVSAQVLLATVPVHTLSAVVNLPPNVTTIMILSNAIGPTTEPITCTGSTSGRRYPGVIRVTAAAVGGGGTAFFTVSPVVDATVTIAFNADPVTVWYVIGLNGLDIVDVPSLTSVVAPETNVKPAYGVMMGGSDGTDLRFMSTDVNGRQIPLVPTTASGVIVVGTAATTIIPAPGTGANYLFGVNLTNFNAQFCTVSANGLAVAYLTAAANATVTDQLNGLRVTTAVTAIGSGVGCNMVIRYAPGP